MRLKELRTNRGMTQAELALQCGLSTSFICDLEAGRCKPSITTALKIASVLGIKDVSELATTYEGDDIAGCEGTD